MALIDVTRHDRADDVDAADTRSEALGRLIRYLPAQPTSGVALKGTGISKAFGGVRALTDVDVEVPAGGFVGLIGPNGAGKSTLFDVLNGFTRPDAGDIVAFGRTVTHLPPWDRAKLGMSRTFQANHIDLNLSVFANLLSGCYQGVRGGILASILRTPANYTDERQAEAMARAVITVLDLDTVAEERAGNLDFGAQRRIEIGRSLMSGPRLLLLDEPTAGLDQHEAKVLMGLVKELQVELGVTILLIEHYVRAVLDHSDLVYALEQGRIIAAGTPAEIAADPAVKAAYLGG